MKIHSNGLAASAVLDRGGGDHHGQDQAAGVDGDRLESWSKMRQELAGEIVICASYQLGRTLIEHDLVDELRLFVYPVVLGADERLFGETSDKKPMRLVDTKTIGDGLTYLSCEMVRDS